MQSLDLARLLQERIPMTNSRQTTKRLIVKHPPTPRVKGYSPPRNAVSVARGWVQAWQYFSMPIAGRLVGPLPKELCRPARLLPPPRSGEENAAFLFSE